MILLLCICLILSVARQGVSSRTLRSSRQCASYASLNIKNSRGKVVMSSLLDKPIEKIIKPSFDHQSLAPQSFSKYLTPSAAASDVQPRTEQFINPDPVYKSAPLPPRYEMGKKMTPSNRKYMDTGLKLRSQYTSYRMLTPDEEKTAGKFSHVGARLEQVKRHVTKSLGREPSKEEWAASCKLTVQQLDVYSALAQRARNKLVQHNMRLVDYWVRRLVQLSKGTRDISYYELMAEGVVGLRRAADHYDGRGASSFGSYAVHYIRAELYQGISRLRPGSFIPHKTVMLYYRSRYAKNKLQAELQRPVSDEEVAAVLKSRVDTVRAARDDVFSKTSFISASTPLQLMGGSANPSSSSSGASRGGSSGNGADSGSGGAGAGSSSTYLDLFLTAAQNRLRDTVEMRVWQRDFTSVLEGSGLTPTERRTIMLRFGLPGMQSEAGLPRSLEHTAALMCLTTEQVRRVMNSAFAKLRSSPLAMILQDGPPQPSALTSNGRTTAMSY